MLTPLDFEKPILEFAARIEDLRKLADDGDLEIRDEIAELEAKSDRMLRQIYAKLEPWQKVQVARHPGRPHTRDYVAALIDDFQPLAGDRLHGEDKAVLSGLGRFRGRAVMVLGHEKGSDTDSRIRHNFGMAHPEGYRKAQRLMRLAERFGLPALTFVDTPGAFPGVEAEARGQAEAIARSIEVCLAVRVPIIATVIGEGGSGGAVALATADAVLMLEHAIYSVISPEGCASILWRSAEHAREAAEALKMTAGDLKALGVIDRVVPEPVGGAHRDHAATVASVGDAIAAALDEVVGLEPGVLRSRRREKFLAMSGPGR